MDFISVPFNIIPATYLSINSNSKLAFLFLMLMCFSNLLGLVILSQIFILATGLISSPQNSFFRYLKWAAMAIIAALSVQYSIFVMYCLPFNSDTRLATACLNPELAATPPAMAISLMPYSWDAFLSFLISILMRVYWREAQISAKLFSIKS